MSKKKLTTIKEREAFEKRNQRLEYRYQEYTTLPALTKFSMA